jgi:hypothetical protein
MSLPDAEIPPPGGALDEEGGNEALPRVTRLNRGLYMLVFYILGAALLLLIVGWIVTTALGKSVPEGLPVIIATIVGAFVGVISSERASS